MWRLKTFWKYLKNRVTTTLSESRQVGLMGTVKELILAPLYAYILMKQDYEQNFTNAQKTKNQLGDSLITT